MNNLNSFNFQNPIRLSFWGSRSKKTYRLLAGIILFIVLIASIYSIAQYLQNIEKIEVLKTKNSTLENEITQLKNKLPVNKQTENSTLDSSKEIIEQLNWPWANVLATLEKKTPENIAIVSMEPASKNALRLQVEGININRLHLYAESLQNDQPFGEINYIRLETNEKDSNQPFRLIFEINLLKS
jgi:hypothetical protein